MAKMGYKARKRWALVVLLVGIPLYIVVAVLAVDWLGRPGILAELGIYTALGVVWAIPLRWMFLGIGQADPDAPPPAEDEE